VEGERWEYGGQGEKKGGVCVRENEKRVKDVQQHNGINGSKSRRGSRM
jgi:hypothetical protein